jgi:ferrous iron transport protein A
MTLAQLPVGSRADILSIGGRDDIAQRLMAMGFLPGTRVRVVGVAPFGDPITVELDGWRCSLRRSEAAALALRPEAPGA